MNSITLSEKDKERFWSKVNIKGENECWEWIAADNGRGYGKFFVGGVSMRYRYAHRISWILEYGDIKKGLQILHRCDNPKCVNPKHLFSGTGKDNMQDAAKKGRIRGGTRGETQGSAKLKNNDIPVIRKMLSSGIKMSEIAKKYCVSTQTIHYIKSGKNWSWVK